MPIQIHSFANRTKFFLTLKTNATNFIFYMYIPRKSKTSQPLPLIQQHAVFLLSWTSHSVSSFLTEVYEIFSYHSSEIVLNLINLDLLILQWRPFSIFSR